MAVKHHCTSTSYRLHSRNGCIKVLRLIRFLPIVYFIQIIMVWMIVIAIAMMIRLTYLANLLIIDSIISICSLLDSLFSSICALLASLFSCNSASRNDNSLSCNSSFFSSILSLCFFDAFSSSSSSPSITIACKSLLNSSRKDRPALRTELELVLFDGILLSVNCCGAGDSS